MEWYEILIGVLGVLGGTTGIIALYKAPAEKQAQEIANLSNIITQERERADAERRQAQEDKKLSQEMISKLRERMAVVESRDKIYYMSIMASYQCRSVESIKDCPVMSKFDELCDKNDGVCEINI